MLIEKFIDGVIDAANDVLNPEQTIITTEQFMQVARTVSKDRAEDITDLLNEDCAKYKITSKNVFHEFVANVTQESGEFAHKRENMSYSAKRMREIWPKRFPTIQSAIPYAHNPIALANLVYGGRMGNKPGTNDGWNFRGGGFIGLTGREVYTKYSIFAGYKSVEQCAEDVRNSDKAALDSAFWFFCVLKDLEDEAAKDDFIGIVKSINGGLIGLPTRKEYYERAKKYIV